MSVYLYSLYALLNFSLLVWAVRLWRPARPAGTGFLALVIVFPWLGLATWRAYGELVES